MSLKNLPSPHGVPHHVLKLAILRLLHALRRDLLVDPALSLNADVESQLCPKTVLGCSWQSRGSAVIHSGFSVLSGGDALSWPWVMISTGPARAGGT